MSVLHNFLADRFFYFAFLLAPELFEPLLELLDEEPERCDPPLVDLPDDLEPDDERVGRMLEPLLLLELLGGE